MKSYFKNRNMDLKIGSNLHSGKIDLKLSKNINTEKQKYALKNQNPVVSKKNKSFSANPLNLKWVSGFNDKINDYTSIIKYVKDSIGFDADSLIKKVRQNDKFKQWINIEGNSIQFKEKGILNLVVESAFYPILRLPLDLLDFFLSALSKLCKKLGDKNGKNIFQKIYDAKFLANQRNKIQAETDLKNLQGMFEKVDNIIKNIKNSEKLNESEKQKAISEAILKQSQKMFNPKQGKYNSVHERSLNRIVTGGVSTVFLAYDAYNLASLCTDDKNEAEEEKKIRRNQEIARLGLTAYLQLITLGALTSLTNSTTWAQHLISGATVFISELSSRLVNGKPVFFMNSEQTKEYNKKQEEKEAKRAKAQKQKHFALFNKNVKNADKTLKETEFAKNEDIKFEVTSNDTSFKGKEKSQDTESGLFTWKNLFRYLGYSILAGVSLKSISKIPKVQEFSYNFVTDLNKYFSRQKGKVAEKFSEILKNTLDSASDTKKLDPIKTYETIKGKSYSKITQKNLTVGEGEFNEVISEFKNAGYEALAKQYREMAKDKAKNGQIELGIVNKKFMKPCLDFFTGVPAFFMSVLKFPYKVFKSILALATSPEAIQKSKAGKFVRNIFDINSKKPISAVDNVTLMTNTYLDLLKQSKNMNKDEFKKYITNCISNSFNSSSVSKNNNADMAFISKMVCSAVTSLFLIADNYNMVMIKSDGEDEEGAWQKAKERTIQRLTQLMYSGLFINLFNTTFMSQYNQSLFNMSMIAGTSQACMDITSRTSIGMPVLPKTKAQIEALEEKHENASGLKGKYFRFMSQVTGKKKLSERTFSKKEESKEKIDAKI